MRVQIPPPEQTKRLKDMAKYLIGIDPGVNTGFSVWDADTRDFRAVCTYGIVEALHEAREWIY